MANPPSPHGNHETATNDASAHPQQEQERQDATAATAAGEGGGVPDNAGERRRPTIRIRLREQRAGDGTNVNANVNARRAQQMLRLPQVRAAILAQQQQHRLAALQQQQQQQQQQQGNPTATETETAPDSVSTAPESVAAGLTFSRQGGRPRFPRTMTITPTMTMSPQMMPSQQQQRVSLPPLVPQPLPYHRADDNNTTTTTTTTTNATSADADNNNNTSSSETNHSTENDIDAARKQFECAICFEFMEDPAGCGKCDNRYCYSCLLRVVNDASKNGANDNSNHDDEPTQSVKCPCCRSNFSKEEIVRDMDLRRRMNLEENITCSFAGCGVSVPLAELRQHEATCPCLLMRCRYATFGCTWTGPKRDLVSHEAGNGSNSSGDSDRGCVYAGALGVLVDQFRQSRADHGHAILQLRHQMLQTNQMIQMQQHTFMARLLQTRSISNAADIVTFVHMITCHPSRFWVTRDQWKCLYHTPEARGTICNILFLLPTFALILRITATGIHHLLQLDRITDEALFDSNLDLSIVALCLTMFGIFFLGFFTIIDSTGATSLSWPDYRFTEQIVFPAEQYVAALLAALIHLACIDFYGGKTTACVTWGFVATATIFFPSVIRTILKDAATPITAAQEESPDQLHGRARSVVFFGLRYGFLGYQFGAIPCMDAILYIRLVKSLAKEKIPSEMTLEDTECFLSKLNTGTLVALFGIRFAMIVDWWNLPDTPISLLSIDTGPFVIPYLTTMAAIVMLLLINKMFSKLEEVGTTLGLTVIQSAKLVLSNDRAASQSELCHMGAMALLAWMMCLGCISVAI